MKFAFWCGTLIEYSSVSLFTNIEYEDKSIANRMISEEIYLQWWILNVCGVAMATPVLLHGFLVIKKCIKFKHFQYYNNSLMSFSCNY